MEESVWGTLLGRKYEFGMWVHLGGVERIRTLGVSGQWSVWGNAPGQYV